MEDCPVCRGAKVIRLPLHQKLTMTPPKAELSLQAEESSRTYPCPECGHKGRHPGIITVSSQQFVDERSIEASKGEVISYVKKNMAADIGLHLLHEGMISFYESDDALGRKIRGVIGVSTAKAAELLDKAAELLDKETTRKASELLDGIDEEVARQISNWGSFYNGSSGMIDKSVAISFMRQVFRGRMERVRGSG